LVTKWCKGRLPRALRSLKAEELELRRGTTGCHGLVQDADQTEKILVVYSMSDINPM
jgi:hypothetical protein